MGAVLSLNDYPQPNRRMKIPLQTEVAKFMEEKMGWPSEFCLHYANKFWNYYQAQGWKLSNGNAMKDWKAAFSSQWQNPKFQEDIDKLNSCKKQIKHMDMAAAVRYFDGILTAYKAGLKPDKESAFQMYDYLKNMGIMKLTKDEIEQCRLKAGNNNDVAKLWALRFFLDKMVQRGLTFKDYVR
jgi:hypothetical protein